MTNEIKFIESMSHNHDLNILRWYDTNFGSITERYGSIFNGCPSGGIDSGNLAYPTTSGLLLLSGYESRCV